MLNNRLDAMELFLAVLLSLRVTGAPLVQGATKGAELPPPPPQPGTLYTPYLQFRLGKAPGVFSISDGQGRVLWESSPKARGIGVAALKTGAGLKQVVLSDFELKQNGAALDLIFHPLPGQPSAWLQIHIRALPDGKTLEFSYATGEGLPVESLRLLDNLLWTTDTENGYIVVPTRMGLLIPAQNGVSFTHTFDTYGYEGCHMEMLGIVKRGAAALVTWDDPYVAGEVKSEKAASDWPVGKQILSLSMNLRKSARSVRVQFLGKGDYVTIAKAYREIAAGRGLLVPWSEKLKGHPERGKLFGAINYKLWALLDREMNEESTKEEAVKVVWTFDEAAQVAEHLKNDLKLDKVLFVMGGWTHRGYDNQHPDIFPASPECGGNDALATCARRVMAQGYLFCLHDNYQDIYRDSPSWNEDLIMKGPDGSLVKGGKWWGGRAYLTCSKQALELARRPQNLPAVKQLTNANSYFIDTTYASGLQECFDPRHPLARVDDMKWKQALSDYARDIFGVFGSEDGREWAIPHSDFFEGLTGVDGSWFHDKKLLGEVGGVSVPIFELVYRESIALYGKYGFDIAQSADYVLYHVSIGRPLNYHDVPPHLYWKESSAGSTPSASASPKMGRDPALFTRAEHGWAEGLHPFDRFVKNTYEILSPLNEITAQMQMTRHEFLSPDRRIQHTVFGEGNGKVEVVVNASERRFPLKSRAGGMISLPPDGFLVESPEFVAFHALSWNGQTYASAPLFTLRSLDGLPLARSRKVRVFHAFGESKIKIGGAIHDVEKEAVLSADAKATGDLKKTSRNTLRLTHL